MANAQLIILIAAALAALVIAIRLYSVLGRRTGEEREPSDMWWRRLNRPPPGPAQPAQVAVPSPAQGAQTFQQPGVFDIQLADKNFDLANFLAGARHAYEIVVTGFAGNDRAAIRPLLSDEVYRVFADAMAGREARGETVAFSFAGFRDVKIDHATLKDGHAEITVAFHAQFTSVTTDAHGAVVEGDAKALRDVVDHWTFARDIASVDPNWTLIATAGPDAI
jgi:predicted lipid-binding transport protein (Tim44 family)